MLLLIGASPAAWAAPRSIRDNRLAWMAGVPSIGRGYSIRNNKLQSMCFEKVQESKPTIDFTYELQNIGEDGTQSSLASDPQGRVKASRLGAFLQRQMQRAREQSARSGRKVRTMLAQVVVDAYHRALDEPSSPLAASARKLLTERRYDAFFSACGFFYVRSVRTFAAYSAVLQFEGSDDAADDERFVGELQQGLLSFNQANPTAEKLLAIKERAESRRLQVFVNAVGLAHGESVNLVPVSIDQFRDTIKAAAGLMAKPGAGVVSQLEIAPWVDHPVVADLLGEGMAVGDDPAGTQLRRSHYMELNSQVVAAIEEYRDFLMSRFHLSSLCEEILNQQYPSDKAAAERTQGRYYDPDKTLFSNQARESDESLWISLRQFREHFKTAPSRALLDRMRDYMYGAAGGEGADACLRELFTKGVEDVDFTKVPSCLSALKVEQENFLFVDEYCLPKPARAVFMVPRSLAE